ncbi:MAG: hypothetical protein IT230_05580 [Flavobacteriales bacterium]|nr:hypothetical protein [Flavobacteriales bacterium]
MKRIVGVATAALLSAAVANAQYWKALGKGTIGPTEIQTLYGDSSSNSLLAGGTFMWIMNENDTVLGMGQAAWDGTRWDSVATRIQPISGNNSTNQTHWFLRFEGRLYACGFFGFQNSDGTWNNNLARLDEVNQHWENLGCNYQFMTGLTTLVPKQPQTTLYATGYMGSICGYPESCVFRYDGSAFHVWEPFNLIPDGNDNYVGTIFDFQGKTYMTCSLPDPVDGSGFVSFLRWNGSIWEHVPGWNTLSPIKEILIHDDTLYVAGTFSLADGGPGNLVAAFSNDQWNNMDGGLQYLWAPMSGAALDLEWFHGELWASGFFNRASDMPASSIAKWNGHQWCVPPGDFRQTNYNEIARLVDMTVWRDSLYVCGSIAYIDWQPAYQVAQWIGGDAMGDCSTVGMDEAGGQVGHLTATPLPGGTAWRVQFPYAGNWVLDVYDALGRHIMQNHSNGKAMELNLPAGPAGVLILRACGEEGTIYQAKLLRP